jgi:hypothetical protein
MGPSIDPVEHETPCFPAVTGDMPGLPDFPLRKRPPGDPIPHRPGSGVAVAGQDLATSIAPQDLGASRNCHDTYPLLDSTRPIAVQNPRIANWKERPSRSGRGTGSGVLRIHREAIPLRCRARKHRDERSRRGTSGIVGRPPSVHRTADSPCRCARSRKHPGKKWRRESKRHFTEASGITLTASWPCRCMRGPAQRGFPGAGHIRHPHPGAWRLRGGSAEEPTQSKGARLENREREIRRKPGDRSRDCGLLHALSH